MHWDITLQILKIYFIGNINDSLIFYTIDMSELYGTVVSARSSLIDLLTTALMGDKLAAEYMLLNLISTV